MVGAVGEMEHFVEVDRREITFLSILPFWKLCKCGHDFAASNKYAQKLMHETNYEFVIYHLPSDRIFVVACCHFSHFSAFLKSDN